MKLAENLREYRKRNHFTQSKLANKLHVSRKTISNWENGRNQPSYQMLDTISSIYKIPATILINGAITKPSKKIMTSYCLNIILLILYYLTGIQHLHVFKYVMLLLLINLIFLTVNYKDWHYTIKNKIILTVIIIAAFFGMMFNTGITLTAVSHKITLIEIAHHDSPFQTGAISAMLVKVIIITYSFFITLFLSKNIKFLFKGIINKLKNR